MFCMYVLLCKYGFILCMWSYVSMFINAVYTSIMCQRLGLVYSLIILDILGLLLSCDYMLIQVDVLPSKNQALCVS